jgi:CubicO group peptidase (beta-lactamase class C family)
MSELEERLRGLHPTIEKILSISGSAGASIGILHNGKVAHIDNFGFRDHAQKQSPDADTLYNIGSLTKSMVAQVVGVLVEEGKLSWNTRVSDVISEFQSQDKSITDHCTIIDLLAHRTGLPMVNVLWYQGGSEPLVEKKDMISMANAMVPSAPFRSSWGYSNWHYCLAGEVIERSSGKPWEHSASQEDFGSFGYGTNNH